MWTACIALQKWGHLNFPHFIRFSTRIGTSVLPDGIGQVPTNERDSDSKSLGTDQKETPRLTSPASISTSHRELTTQPWVSFP
jgi:hypothetical protein